MNRPEPSLLDMAVVAEIFSLADAPEDRALVQEMFTSVHQAARREMENLTGDEEGAVLRTRLHRLKGMMGNFGFAACAQLLAEWERDGSGGEMAARRASLLERLDASRAELVRRYPWLQ